MGLAAAGGRAYQKLKGDYETLAAARASDVKLLTDRLNAHDEKFDRWMDQLSELNKQLTELVRHEERLDNYHKRLQKVEDTHISVLTMANSVREIRQKVFERP